MIILGLETSCDETAVGIVDGGRRIRANRVASQLTEHKPYGGVVPEIAARAHLDKLDDLIHLALDDAKISLDDLAGIAATCGPGLIGGVMVGAMTGKAIAAARQLPFIAVNHLEAHALTARLTHDVAFPYLLLLVSGGHCQLLLVKGVGEYRILGTTIDDAVGECFDKGAKFLGLGYPGGPAVERAATDGDANAFELPRPMLGRKGCDFSFSGLKTALRLMVDEKQPCHSGSALPLRGKFMEARTVYNDHGRRCRRQFAQELHRSANSGEMTHLFATAASLQAAIAGYSLPICTKNALEMLRITTALVAAGGVAANQAIRARSRNWRRELRPALCRTRAGALYR